jgi:hypothetical protein
MVLVKSLCAEWNDVWLDLVHTHVLGNLFLISRGFSIGFSIGFPMLGRLLVRVCN